MEQDRLQRKSNFELLRIVAMLFIVGSHLACHGVQHCLNSENGYQLYFTGSTINKFFCCLLTPQGGRIGVAIFFLLTGYFQVNKASYSIKKVVLEVIYYGWISILLLAVFLIEGITFSNFDLTNLVKQILLGIFNPVTGGYWWFVSAYVFLMILSPQLNLVISKTTKKGHFALTLIMYFLWYVIGYFGSYYSGLLQGIFFYFVGSFIALYGKKIINRRKGVYIIISIILWLLAAGLTFISLEFSIRFGSTMETKIIAKACSVLSDTVIAPVIAIFIFKIFEASSDKNRLVINTIAKTTFGVYLLHDSPVARELLWNNLLQMDQYYSSDCFPLWALFFQILIFCFCSIIDYGRIRAIEPFVLKKLESKKRAIKELDNDLK